MATLTVRRGYFVLNWSDEAGRHRKSLGRVGVLSKKDAEAIWRAKELELSTGAVLLGHSLKRAISFGQYAKDYLLWHQREYPDSHYRVSQILHDHLLPAFRHTPLDMLTPKLAEQYKHDRQRQVSAGSVVKELRTLKAVINKAVADDILSRNPIEHVAAPKILDSKPHRFYEADELEALYEKVCEPIHAPIWRLFANTGMRRMEGLYLKRRWIGKDGLKIISTGEERTKSGEWREIPLSDGARIALDALPKAGEYVLPRIRKESLSRAFARDASRADLDGSLHTLRHTYISHLVRAGVPLRTVQIYAGHANYVTTEKYSYLCPGVAPAQARVLSL
jgi:integrase